MERLNQSNIENLSATCQEKSEKKIAQATDFAKTCVTSKTSQRRTSGIFFFFGPDK